MLTAEEKWDKLCDLIDQGRVSIILEKQLDTIDGGLIISDPGELGDFLEGEEA